MPRSRMDTVRGVNARPPPGRRSVVKFRAAVSLSAAMLLSASLLYAEETAEKPLLFLGNRNLEPVVYEKDGLPAGFAVDLVRALEKKIGRPITIECMDWTKAQEMVAGGEADALIQINSTEERKRLYDFSEPFIQSKFSIFMQGDRTEIAGAESLRGLRVGVERNGFPDRVLREDPLIRLVFVPDFLEGFSMLARGELDAVVVDQIVGVNVLARNRIRGVRIAPEPVAFSQSAIAVRKGNAELLSAVNAGLRKIRRDGTYANIQKVWERKEVLYLTREQIQLRIFAPAIGALSLLVVIAIAWTVTLHRELWKRGQTELRLKDQYSTLRGIVESVDALMFSVDREYRYTSFNKAHADIMKAIYGTEIGIGRVLLDAMTVDEDRETARRNLDRALAGEHLEEEAYSGEAGRDRRYFRVAHSPILSLEGAVVGVAALSQDITERKRIEEDLRRLNREMRAISTCNRTVLRADDERSLLSEVCRIVCDEAGYRMAWVGYAEQDAAKSVRPVAWAGIEDGYLDLADITWADAERGHGPSGTAIRSGESACIQDFAADPRAAPWRENALRHGYRSSLALPLKDGGARTFGALCIYSTDAGAFTPDEVRLIGELADNLAFGIVVLRTRAERLADLRFLESMDRINRVMQGNGAMESISSDILDVVLSVLDGDRAILLYPCDPDAGSVALRVDRSASPGENVPGVEIPMDPELSQAIRALLASGEQEIFCTGSGLELPKAIQASLGSRSLMAMALRPKVGKPWLFGILRHASIRGWSAEERRLFLESGRRLGDALTSLLAYRDLLESEEKLRGLNAELERRVADRTARLLGKNAELERLNRIFIGREKRMIELKERIRSLEPRDGGDATDA